MDETWHTGAAGVKFLLTERAGVKFLLTELAAARAFMEIAETSPGDDILLRSLHNAETAIDAIHRVLTCSRIDPLKAEEIRSAAHTISGQLSTLATGLLQTGCQREDSTARIDASCRGDARSQEVRCSAVAGDGRDRERPDAGIALATRASTDAHLPVAPARS